MDYHFIVTVFCVFCDLTETFLGETKYKPKMTPPELMLVAVVAARYFDNNLERALLILGQTGDIPPGRWLSVS